MHRHFTVTGFVSHEGQTALHWHARMEMWLPPGGHIEPDEDPLQAVLREVREETGLDVEVLPSGAAFAYAAPPRLPVPAAMAMYDIPRDGGLDEAHQHIDLIYFTRPRAHGGAPPALPQNDDCWAWVDAATLRVGAPLAHERGRSAPVAGDVRELGLAAIAAARQA